MKKKNIFIIIVGFIFFLLLIQKVSPIREETLGGILEAGSSIIVEQILKSWMIFTIHTTHDFFDSIYRNLPHLILSNPKVENFSSGMSFFMNMLIPFYVLGIIFTAFYLLFVSGSPEGRANAKGNLFKLIYSLFFISISPLLLNLLFSFSYTTTNFILNLFDKSVAINALRDAIGWFYGQSDKLILLYPDAGGGAGPGLFTTVPTFTYFLFYIIMVGRYVFLNFFGMLFPFAIFLYSFFSTRSLGKMLLNQLLIITFIQIIWAVALAVIATVVLTTQQVGIHQQYINFASFFFFALSPLILLGLADWFGIVVLIVDTTTTGPLCVGPVVMDELYVGREVLPEEVAAEVEYM